jgi:hypothetical protein
MTRLRPIATFRPVSDHMAWERIVALFRQHGLEPPPVRLRDELVNHLVWAEYGWGCAEDADAVAI